MHGPSPHLKFWGGRPSSSPYVSAPGYSEIWLEEFPDTLVIYEFLVPSNPAEPSLHPCLGYLLFTYKIRENSLAQRRRSLKAEEARVSQNL